MLACRMPIRRHFRPQNSVGGRNSRLALSGSGFAGSEFIPLRPRWGYGGKRKEGYRFFPFRSFSLVTQRPLAAPPALRRRLTAGGIITPASVGHDITPQVIVDKFFDQCRAVETHHGGVNVKPLRRFQGKMDR
jgi:hypothetical protein